MSAGQWAGPRADGPRFVNLYQHGAGTSLPLCRMEPIRSQFRRAGIIAALCAQKIHSQIPQTWPIQGGIPLAHPKPRRSLGKAPHIHIDVMLLLLDTTGSSCHMT